MHKPCSKQPLVDQLFDAANAHFATMKETLVSDDFQGRPEVEVERWLCVEQHELMRRLLQSHLTLRGFDQAVGPVVGVDETKRTHVSQGKVQQLETTFGTVTIAHSAWRTRLVGSSSGGRQLEPAKVFVFA